MNKKGCIRSEYTPSNRRSRITRANFRLAMLEKRSLLGVNEHLRASVTTKQPC